MAGRSAFTLIEVLISIALISLVLLGLYQSLDIQRSSNRQLHDYLQKALKRDRAVMALYNDLLSSDGNLTIIKGEFDRLCINNTVHSLYGLSSARVCWIVLKEGRELVRVEGGEYRLPLNSESRVAIDRVMGPMELFDITRRRGEILVAMKRVKGEPYAFLMQGIEQPPKMVRKRKAPKKKEPKSNPSGNTGKEKK